MITVGKFGDEFEVAAVAFAFYLCIEIYEGSDLYDHGGTVYNSANQTHDIMRLQYRRSAQH